MSWWPAMAALMWKAVAACASAATRSPVIDSSCAAGQAPSAHMSTRGWTSDPSTAAMRPDGQGGVGSGGAAAASTPLSGAPVESCSFRCAESDSKRWPKATASPWYRSSSTMMCGVLPTRGAAWKTRNLKVHCRRHWATSRNTTALIDGLQWLIFWIDAPACRIRNSCTQDMISGAERPSMITEVFDRLPAGHSASWEEKLGLGGSGGPPSGLHSSPPAPMAEGMFRRVRPNSGG
mmetsp:Transcript_34145/g.96013  ORF Transcript_34145/g.96013 Transcript_34145/m.96013 type:complete len:235 (-) Transcript_34145:200-904(-)